jgi:hypothetical protein
MATPITQRAATKYGSAPANQEVTVDAAGKNAAKFERMSPLKQSTEVPDPIVTTDMGQDEAGNAREVTKTTNYSQADDTLIPGGNETRIKTAADAGVPQEEVDAYNMKKYGTKNPTKEGLTNNTIETGNKLADTVVPGEITATETKEVKDPTEERDTYEPWDVRRANRARIVADRGVRKAQRQFDKGKIGQESLDAAKSQASSTYAQQNKGKNAANSDTYKAREKGDPNSTVYDSSGNEVKQVAPQEKAPPDPKTQTVKEFRVQKRTERKEARQGAAQEKQKQRIQERHDRKTAPAAPEAPVEMRSAAPTKMWGAAKSGKTPFKMGGYMSKNK